MSDKAIILSVILAAVLCVAVPFIFRVCRYRRRMKTLIVPDGPSGEVAVGTVPTPEAEYLARYICLLRLPFAGNKHVKIRPSYHERIREITRVIGRGDVTITAYVDKVLRRTWTITGKPSSGFSRSVRPWPPCNPKRRSDERGVVAAAPLCRGVCLVGVFPPAADGT